MSPSLTEDRSNASVDTQADGRCGTDREPYCMRFI
jgi:hypothetical protein